MDQNENQPEADDDDIFSHLENNDVEFDGVANPFELEPIVIDRPMIPADDDIPEAQCQIRRQQLRNGLELFSGSLLDGSSPVDVLTSIVKQHDLYWAINTKHAGLTLSKQLKLNCPDLLKKQPEHVRFDNSLHIIPPVWTVALSKTIEIAIANDAAICFATQLAPKQVQEQITPIASYLAKASGLQSHLEHSNEFVQQQLFGVPEFIFIQVHPDSWILFNHPARPMTWQEIGLPAAPE